jgi:hypothetical protein
MSCVGMPDCQAHSQEARNSLHTNKMQRVIAKSKPPNLIETLSSQSTTELGIER